jgi:hypothetical protein
MKYLAVLIAELFGTLFVWIAGFIGSKVAVGAVVAVTAVAMVTSLFFALKALTVGVVSLVPNETFRMVFFTIWPSNAETCIVACLAADISVFMYKLRSRLLSLMSQ